MSTRDDAVTVALAVGLTLEIVFIEVSTQADVGISMLTEEIEIAGVLIVPTEERNTKRGIHRLLPIVVVKDANAERTHGEEDAAAGLALPRGMHHAHFLACPTLPLWNQHLNRLVERQSQFGTVSREDAVESCLTVVVEMNIAVVHHTVLHVPHTVHTAAHGRVAVIAGGEEINRGKIMAIQQRVVGLHIRARPHVSPPRFLVFLELVHRTGRRQLL